TIQLLTDPQHLEDDGVLGILGRRRAGPRRRWARWCWRRWRLRGRRERRACRLEFPREGPPLVLEARSVRARRSRVLRRGLGRATQALHFSYEHALLVRKHARPAPLKLQRSSGGDGRGLGAVERVPVIAIRGRARRHLAPVRQARLAQPGVRRSRRGLGAVGAKQVLVCRFFVFSAAAAAGHAAQIFAHVEAREGPLLFLLFRL
ncbi:unnamed protein product, partial [Pelagomonas calceolata]